MNRTEGLVLRKNVVAQNVERSNNINDDLDKHHSDDQEEEDVDSKETRLTLMEEVLLLGLKDKEVFTLALTSLTVISQMYTQNCNIKRLLQYNESSEYISSGFV